MNTVSRVEQDEVGDRGPQPVTIAAIRRVYEAAVVEFIAENGGGAGVRLRKQLQSTRHTEGEAGIIENNDM